VKSVLAVVALALLLSTPADSARLDGNTITLDDEDIAACIAGGGCGIITRKALDQLREAALACRLRT
jgi:hypothetical protein